MIIKQELKLFVLVYYTLLSVTLLVHIRLLLTSIILAISHLIMYDLLLEPHTVIP